MDQHPPNLQLHSLVSGVAKEAHLKERLSSSPARCQATLWFTKHRSDQRRKFVNPLMLSICADSVSRILRFDDTPGVCV